MKNLICLSCLFALWMTACSDEEVVNETNYIHGSVMYRDAETGDTIVNQSAIESWITRSDGALLPIAQQDTLDGAVFEFGPLQTAYTYIISSRYFDQQAKILYTGKTVQTIASGKQLTETAVFLQPSPSTVSLKGVASYTDLFTGLSNLNQEYIVSRLKKKSGRSFASGPVLERRGASFRFDSLQSGETYLLESSFRDSVENIDYRTSREVTLPFDTAIVTRNLSLQPDISQSTLKGNIKYRNPLTGEISNASHAQGSIVYLNPVRKFTESVTTSSSGTSYSFGPLLPAQYVLTFSGSDELFSYTVKDTLRVEGTAPVVFHDYQLEWEKETILVVEVKDTIGNAIPGADVYLYNNYGYLTRYKDNAAVALRNGVTDQQGRIVFKGLTSVPHYSYATKIFANDTLTSFDPDFDPATVDAILENEINFESVSLKH